MSLALALASLPMLAGVARADGSEDWKTDAGGRRFRVAFDLGSRLVLGGLYDGAGAFDAGLFVRERDDDGVQWKLDHAFAVGRVWGDGRLDATLYRGRFLRWSKDGALTIPTEPPSRIRLPFDVGFDVALGRVRVDPHRDELRVGTVAADLLFDFWRSYDFGSYLLLRTGVAYDVAVDRSLTATPTHLVTPFSRIGLDLAHTWDSGRETFGMTAVFSHHTSLRGREQRWSSEAEALVAYELVLVAIDDDPVTARLEGSWRWDGDTDQHELRGTIALRLGIPTD